MTAIAASYCMGETDCFLDIDGGLNQPGVDFFLAGGQPELPFWLLNRRVLLWPAMPRMEDEGF